MRLAIVVKHLGQVFSRYLKLVGEVVISGRNDDLARAVVVDSAGTVGGGDAKVAIIPGDRLHPLILADVKLVVLRDPAVVLKRFLPCGLLVGGVERNVADLE